MKEAVALTSFASMRFALDTFKTCFQLTGQAEMPRRQVEVRDRRDHHCRLAGVTSET